jgi:hypothetical protein
MSSESIEDWIYHFQNEIENLKLRLSEKADIVLMEEMIWRHHDEDSRSMSTLPKVASVDAAIPQDPEGVCADFVGVGNLKLGFSALLRHIGSISVTKAERNDVTGKATKTYTDSLVDRLIVLTGHEIEEATTSLQTALATRLAVFKGEFHRTCETVNCSLNLLELDIHSLDGDLSYLKRQKALPFKTKVGYHEELRDGSETDIAPRRQALHRSLQKSHKRIVELGRSKTPSKTAELGDPLTIIPIGK